MKDGLAILAGGLFVLVYGWHRFSDPSTNRSSTTAVRYYMASTFYSLWGLLLYVGLVAGLTLFPNVVTSFSEASGVGISDLVQQLQGQGLSSPLVVALLLTTLLPNIPALAYIDRRVREQLEHMAAIPYEVRRLMAELERSDTGAGVTFTIARSVQDRVRQRMHEQNFLRGEILFNGGRDLRALWTKVSVLMLYLGDWRSERRFSAFCGCAVEKPDEITQAYEELLARVRRCLRTAAPDSQDAQGAAMMSEYRSEVERQVKALLRRIYGLISAATLQCEFTHGDREGRLARLGFSFGTPWRPSPLLLAHRLAALFTGLFVILLAIFAFAMQIYPSMPLNYPRAVGLSVLVPLTYVVAVFWAMLLKARWAVTTRRRFTRPVLSYGLAGLLTAATNVPISLAWTHFSRTGTGSLKADVLKSLTWVILSATTAFLTAVLIDDQPKSFARRWGGRWSEGSVQAIVTAAMAFVVYQMLSALGYQPRTPIEVLLVLGGVIGFVIGTLIPTWYREAPRHREGMDDLGPHRLRRPRRGRRPVAKPERPAPPLTVAASGTLVAK